MFFKIIYIFILLFIVNSKCQLISLTPDADIQIINSDQNEFTRYPPQSNGNTCSFSLRFIVRDKVEGRESYYYGLNYNLSIISSISNDFFYIYQNVPIQNNNVYYIDIFYDNDIKTKSSFLVQLNCKEIIQDNIEISLVKDKAYYDKGGYQATFIRIEGLEYQLDQLSTSPNIQAFKVSNQLHLLFLASVMEYPKEVIEFSIKFTKRTFTFTISPSYSMDSYQAIDYEIYPSNIISTPYKENGFYNSPMMLIKSNLTFQDAYTLGKTSKGLYYIPKRISVSNNGLSFNYIFQFLSGTDNYYFVYNNGSNANNKTLSLKITKDTNSLLPTGNILEGTNIFTFEMDSSSLVGYSFKNNIFNHEYLNRIYKFSSSFPFGFAEGSLLAFNYKVDYSLKPKTNTFFIYEAPQDDSLGYNIVGPDSDDYSIPVLSFFEFIYITKFKYLLRFRVSDDSGISFIKFNTEYYGYESLVEGTILNGTFEIVVDVFTTSELYIYDGSGTSLSLISNSYAFSDSNGIPVFFDAPSVINFDQLEINSVSFLENNINITNKENYNIFYFNTSQPIDKDTPIQFVLYDDLSYSNDQVALNSFSVYWDDSLKLYYSPFIVPKNSDPNQISYSLCFSALAEFNGYLLDLLLNVSSTNFDNDGPMITSIVNANSFNKVGWRIKVEDSQNGFSRGYVKAVGSVDGSIFKFNFTLDDSISTTIDTPEFELFINITESLCITQSYQIIYIHLLDSNNRESVFELVGKTYSGYKNPLRYLLDQPELLVSESVCQNSILDTSAPFLTLLSINKRTVDIGSLDRLVTFNFTAVDQESGLMSTQSPVIYLLSSEFKLLECESTVISINSTTANYYCEIMLPLGFSYPGSQILISLYNLINNAGKFRGYSTTDLESNSFISTLDVSLSLDQPVLLNYEKYLSYSSELIIYGRLLKDITSGQIQISNGLIQNNIVIIKSILGSSVIKIHLNSTLDKEFKIRLSTKNSIYSNWFTITPTYYKANIPTPPLPTDTPLPTNVPQKCLGDPICGGITHGTCNNETGCICIYPWKGKLCQDKVIEPVKPEPNPNEPSTEINIPNYKSLISLYSLREVDINGKAIKNYLFNDKWTFNEISDLKSNYQINITTGTDSFNTTISATLEWFNQSKVISFANQSLEMNPNSIKYSIEISKYPFSSDLCYLQLVMSATLSSTSIDSCSSKDFGDTTEGDNSNYVNIQIDNKSLYGRFIKRGIIDNNKLVSLSNQVLDSTLNAISKPSQSQSFIGITIQHYEERAFIDPDFSVLLSSETASSYLNSVCSNKNLSAGKIAGIVVGVFAFLCVLAVGIVYILYKRKKDKLFKKNIDNKLKSINN